MNYLLAKSEQVLLSTQEILRKFRELVNLTFHKNGIPISYDQWIVLNVLAKKQGVKQIVVSRATKKEPASISRILVLLERKEMIQKVSDISDKKANRIYLTPYGSDVHNRATEIFNKLANDGFNGIYEQEINLFVRIIEKVQGNFIQMRQNGQSVAV